MAGNAQTIPVSSEDPPPPAYDAATGQNTVYNIPGSTDTGYAGAQNPGYAGVQNPGYAAQNPGYVGAQNPGYAAPPVGYPGPPQNQYSAYGSQPTSGADQHNQQQMQNMMMMGAMTGNHNLAVAGMVMASQQQNAQYNGFGQTAAMPMGQPTVRVRRRDPANMPDPNPHLTLSIIACILCPMLGIVALIQSCNVKKSIQRGDKEHGHRLSAIAMRMAITAIIVGGLTMICMIPTIVVYAVILS